MQLKNINVNTDPCWIVRVNGGLNEYKTEVKMASINNTKYIEQAKRFKLEEIELFQISEHHIIMIAPEFWESTSPFGFSYLLDMYDCMEGLADNLELHYRFLETLVEKLGMDKMSAPIVIHAPTKDGKELYPDKAGVSGWVPLVQSGIQIHSLEPSHFISLDVYSCKKFDPQVVKDFARECFAFKECEENFIKRGTNYGSPRTTA